ncbi:MAG: hypothetical protein KKB62_02880 [Nanoarchaeota archaeon]|jgi:flagellar biosynthesis protein FliR|nr:hypothetical protein [Nanoarchaeota archaeon]
MSELAVGQIVKIILGILVVIAVIAGLYFVFKNNILEFFEGLGGVAPPSFWRALL